MHPALFRLLVLSTKGVFRRTFRGVKTFRGAFLLLFTIGVVVMFLGPSLVAATMMPRHAGMPQFAGMAEPYLPLFILGFCLLLVLGPAGEMALAFRPAEVDFLFPAPFHRRELLIYKLAKMLLSTVFMALIFSVSFLIYLHSWLSAFVGILLTLAFTQLIALVTSLARQIVAEYAYTLTRKLIWMAMAALVAAGLAQMLWQAPVQSIAELAHRFRSTWTGIVLLAPFEVFSHAILAEAWFPDLVCWAAAAAAIDLGLLALILKLDTDYLEAAAAVSQKLYERLQRARQGGGFAPETSKYALRLRVPRLPWMQGSGPLAWRQLLLAMRTSRYVILLSLGIGVVLLVVAAAMGRAGPGADMVPVMGISFLAYLTFIFTMQLPWAFRGDIDHIDFLKTLPVAPLALATGELAGGVVVLAAIQLVLLAALLATGANPTIVLVAAAFVVPFDVLMLAMNNLLFLIYPVRIAPATSADFQLFGRLMLFMLLDFLILIPTLGIPAAVGAIAFFVSGSSWPAFAVTSWLALVAELPLMLILLAWTFERFDPSTETPA